MNKEQVGDGTLENWSVDEVADALQANRIVLIDIRTPQEYLLESIDGAFLMPMAVFEAEKLPEDGDRPLVLFCGSSKRSEKIARSLLEKGRQTARHMSGGFAAWKKAERPYRTVDLPSGEVKIENE